MNQASAVAAPGMPAGARGKGFTAELDSLRDGGGQACPADDGGLTWTRDYPAEIAGAGRIAGAGWAGHG